MKEVFTRVSEAIRERGVVAAGRKAARHGMRPILIPPAIVSLRSGARRVTGIDAALDLAYTFNFHGIVIDPWQARSEIGQLLAELKSDPPHAVLEIGTGTGGTLFLVTQVAAPDAVIVSVDLPSGEFGGGYALWRAPLYRSFASNSQRVELIRGDSHSERTREHVREALRGRRIDLLFIDGDHSYDGVKQDFEMYAQLVSEDGLIAFHDIVPGKRAPGEQDRRLGIGNPACVGDVPAFWNDFRRGRQVQEFVEDWEQGSFGIGVVKKSDALQTTGD